MLNSRGFPDTAHLPRQLQAVEPVLWGNWPFDHGACESGYGTQVIVKSMRRFKMEVECQTRNSGTSEKCREYFCQEVSRLIITIFVSFNQWIGENFQFFPLHLAMRSPFRVVSRWWFQTFFYFHPYLGRWSNSTSIFFKGVVQPPTRFDLLCQSFFKNELSFGTTVWEHKGCMHTRSLHLRRRIFPPWGSKTQTESTGERECGYCTFLNRLQVCLTWRIIPVSKWLVTPLSKSNLGHLEGVPQPDP